MKTNCWLVLGVMIATSAVAQVNTNSAPAAPAPVVMVPVPPVTTGVAPVTTNAPAKKAAVKHKKTIAKKKGAKTATKSKKSAVAKPEVAAAEAPVTLLPGDAEVATEHVNVRGQAGVKGEVIAHLKKGDKVTVIAEITLDKHKADEPAQWAKIALPADVKVWVNAKFVDAANKVVSAKKLNVRGGAGENYSVLGVLEQGAPINQVSAKGDWLQIDAPTNAYAFVAASLLKPSATPTEPVATAVTPTPTPTLDNPPVTPAIPAVPTTTNTLADAPPIVTTPVATVPDSNTAAVTPPVTPVADSNAVAAVTPPTNAIPVVAADEETNLPPRIVTHEGIVHPVRSIIAPTYYQLDDQVSGREINYLYTTTTNLDISHYKGLHVIVTGEESLAARWKDTPLLTIQRIQVVE